MHAVEVAVIVLELWGMCSMLEWMFLHDWPEPPIQSHRVRVVLIVLGPVSLIAMTICQTAIQFYEFNRDWVRQLRGRIKHQPHEQS